MNITFGKVGWEDYLWFQENDRKLLKKINSLIKYMQRSPFEGIGKPEQLKGNLSGYWSRRINAEHRLVYTATEEEIFILACRFHYQIDE
ncbi:Txe/YoeB family addiction module toxin [Roseofilum casamattae]|uniref:Endoribonuclease YoeB n=1 Tax=Roseofilum casamattae BLCC-M143 TaxID=3022442 RepID=A0ABT7BR91_9CYAN|nr:Txe/YoeB family addiction module toxin [Roseofilum casamattae]MDJ1181705.1 Txe/YoeB family addiction module toxin [Roseofilum casamattae BLCC-M143]